MVKVIINFIHLQKVRGKSERLGLEKRIYIHIKNIFMHYIFYIYMQEIILDLLIKTNQNQVIGKRTGFGPNSHLQS